MKKADFKKTSTTSKVKAYSLYKEKPLYKGKIARIAGATRSETRKFIADESFNQKFSSKKFLKTEPSLIKHKGLNKKFVELITSKEKEELEPDTSWGGVAKWYNRHLEKEDDTYHTKVIFPNVLRLLKDMQGKKVLDMACGQGIFAERLRDVGAFVTGVDIGKDLITIAKKNSESIEKKGTHKVVYHVGSAENLDMLKDKSFDIVICILALQNIENLGKTIGEASRVLVEGGTFIFIINHPSFRNPKQSYWGFNHESSVQYRRVDEYMSERGVEIDMHPGSTTFKKMTKSFHRPLQGYLKSLFKAGFVMSHFEEWVSHKESEKGPKQHAENKARKEIPMFMYIEGKKQNIKH